MLRSIRFAQVAGAVLTLATLSACGGSGHHEHASGGQMSGGEQGGQRREHPAFPEGPVTAFHEVLGPLWHSEPGPDRDARACAQSEVLQQRAGAIASAPVPAEAQAREAGWREASASLVQASDALRADCTGPSHAAPPTRLEAVHTAFHHLIENLPRREGH